MRRKVTLSNQSESQDHVLQQRSDDTIWRTSGWIMFVASVAWMSFLNTTGSCEANQEKLHVLCRIVTASSMIYALPWRFMFAWASLVWWCAMICMSLVSLYYSRVIFKTQDQTTQPRHQLPVQLQRGKSSKMPDQSEWPGVTILRPMKGADSELEHNLRCSFEMDYPLIEIVLSVADRNDPAIEVARRLIHQYPHVDARLIIGDQRVGVNPKINNLYRGYQSAKYDLIWVCDSNVTLAAGSLRRSVQMLGNPRVGLVHHMPRGVGPRNFGALLEALYLVTSHARSYLFLNMLGRLLSYFGIPLSCVIGKSTLFRKHQLETMGGMRHFGQYLAEDYMMGLTYVSHGYLNAMTEDLVSQSLGSCTWQDYALRRIRWSRLRTYLMPLSSVIEPLSEALGCGLAVSLGAWHLLHHYGIYTEAHIASWLFAVHLLLWSVLDALIFRAYSERADWPSLTTFFTTWFIREVSYPFMLLYAVSGNTVGWRGQSYRLRLGGHVEPYVATETLWSRVFRVLRRPFLRALVTTSFVVLRLLIEVLTLTERTEEPAKTTFNSSHLSTSSSDDSESETVTPVADSDDAKMPLSVVMSDASYDSGIHLKEGSTKKQERAQSPSSASSSESLSLPSRTSQLGSSTARLSLRQLWGLMYMGVAMHLQNEWNAASQRYACSEERTVPSRRSRSEERTADTDLPSTTTSHRNKQRKRRSQRSTAVTV